MELLALKPAAPRTVNRPIQVVLVRANGPLFYSLAAASLLEASLPLAADRLLHFFSRDRVFAQWLNAHWLPRKLERARQLRDYIEATWPEFDWTAGYEQFRAAGEANGAAAGPRRPTAAHEALARCVATAQTGIFYRSLARWADDPRLRALAAEIASEEASSFTHFRTLYDQRLRTQGMGCTAAWTTALGCVRAARDSQVPRAFSAISAQCPANVPFPVLEYPEFVTRMGNVIERHGNLGTPERIVFRMWRARPNPPPEQPQQRRAAALPFTPVLAKAA